MDWETTENLRLSYFRPRIALGACRIGYKIDKNSYSVFAVFRYTNSILCVRFTRHYSLCGKINYFACPYSMYAAVG
jgi:hypothetical protein